MSLFFPSSKPKASVSASKPSVQPKPHTGGQVTPREFARDVMGRLRRDGMSTHDRDIVEASAAGFLDTDHRKIGMTTREKDEFVEHLTEDASKLGLSKTDLGHIDDALDRSL